MGVADRDYMKERPLDEDKPKLIAEATVTDLMREIASRSLACACIAVGLDTNDDGRLVDSWKSAVTGSPLLCEQLITTLARNVATHIKDTDK